MNRSKQGALIVLGLFLAFGVGRITVDPDESAQTEVSEGEEDVTYTCPMHPQIRQDGPGSCPICHMDLVPAASGGGGDAIVAVQMSEGARRMARVQNGYVQRGPVSGALRVYGEVGINENAEVDLAAWTAGRIEELKVNAVGEQVRRGQLLARVYSPELLAGQRNLVLARRNLEAAREEESARRAGAAEAALEAARTELRLLGMEARQIAEVERSGEVRETVDVFATAAGTVRSRLVSEGEYVERGERILSLAALETVWVQLEIFEQDAHRVKVGAPVVVEGPAGEVWEGRIGFMSPEIDREKRVARARVVLENHGGELRPGAYVTARVEVGSEEDDVLTVPRSAVLWTGKRSLVYVYDRGLDPAGYVPREVVLGERVGERYVIVEGLEEGEELAIRGAFRIDASLQVQGGPTMMSAMHGSVELPKTVGDGPKVEVPEEGEEFDPPIDVSRVPEGTWYCDMGTTHWVQRERGDGECPICGMQLAEKKGEDGQSHDHDHPEEAQDGGHHHEH